MARAGGTAPMVGVGVAAAVAAFNLPWLLPDAAAPAAAPGMIAALITAGFVGLAIRKSRPNALNDLAVTLLGALYVGLMGGYLVQAHVLAGGRLVFYIVAVAKMADIGGYLTGKFLGRHKLAPGISPNKTIEGSLGGLALSIAVAVGFAFVLPPLETTLAWQILFAVVVNAASQFGDLAESMIKRSCEVKDSAVFLPKVCGALDLIDSVLISAPVGYYLYFAAKAAQVST